MMTETRSERLNALVAKWMRQAQRLDDYRGIQMCMRDVEEALKLTEAVIPADVKTALKQGTDLLAQLGGKPFVPQIKDVITALNSLCVVVRTLNIQAAEQQKTINELTRKLEVALTPAETPPQGVKVTGA